MAAENLNLMYLSSVSDTKTNEVSIQWRSEGPAGPATAGGPEGLKGPARGPPGRSSRSNPLARGPNKLFAGGPENRRYATVSIHMK